ncbi:quinone-dependent dihydroorotate dehydrogenase [Brevibacterium daeguense]|uniref:Dihydroorotate dehydrogenase (quinone) n=1 Tax=Brevibacterium daeguense TaxID=909936 RepID=A0ABP8ENN7_9MICO
MYSLIFRTVFVPMDAERAHRVSFTGLRALDRIPGLRVAATRVFGRGTSDPVEVIGLPFPNRLGLAAGFDKNAAGVRALALLGFGHVEVGTLTAHSQPGNPRPRLFRLLDHRAIVNRMGFNNDGARKASFNLRTARARIDRMPAHRRPVIGVNIGKTKVVDAARAAEDYRTSAEILAPLADYLVINVSSPNTPGLRDLQSTRALEPIIRAVREAAAEAVETPRSTLGHVPLLVKIAPDLSDEDVIDIAELALRLGVDGLITTNTTVDRGVLDGRDRARAEAEAGGISGEPLADRSFEVLRLVKRRVGDGMTVISVGGIADERDVRARLAAGADLVQVYSGLIYGGPFWVGRMLRRLRR